MRIVLLKASSWSRGFPKGTLTTSHQSHGFFPKQKRILRRKGLDSTSWVAVVNDQVLLGPGCLFLVMQEATETSPVLQATLRAWASKSNPRSEKVISTKLLITMPSGPVTLWRLFWSKATWESSLVSLAQWYWTQSRKRARSGLLSVVYYQVTLQTPSLFVQLFLPFL